MLKLDHGHLARYEQHKTTHTIDHQVFDMTPVAAEAWTKIEEARRDAVVLPSRQHTYRTALIVAALVILPLITLLGVPLPAVLTSTGVLSGVWATIEIVRVVRKR